MMVKDAASTPTRRCIYEPHAFNAHALAAAYSFKENDAGKH
eukprot:CAMPEP_0183337524 /NCGR_PEP_ID=MMETSP0164_2-20130417/5134_1 /TAXON_ID=221442 /ORGANISM="Coccolithus pelagicus ssp braarudi, Strain PLY182g" /LENGTH=40 /DNA_ID= /DNA_START= /DNA_END= /DNA_ORIENTATION=